MSDLFFNQNTSPISTTSNEPSLEPSSEFLNPKSKNDILNPQIDFIFTRRQKEFIPHLMTLQYSSSKAIRRKVSKGLKAIITSVYKAQIQEWQNRESDRETFLNLSNCLDKIDRTINNQNGQNGISESEILSVSEICKRIKNQIGDQKYVIQAELNDVKFYNTLIYFVLKDPDSEQLLYGYLPTNLASRLDFPLNDGLNVLVTGKFTINKRSGLNFVVSSITLTGQGELERNFKLLHSKLEKEGLFDPTFKKSLKEIPKRVLLIASSQGAAIGDYVKVLGQRRQGIIIYHLPIKTQGQSSEGLLLEKLALVNHLTITNQIETIIITRGGGGKDDLVLFNSEQIVRAIKNLNRPTIVAIGHEQDTTLAELAADVRASTPSNAAMLTSLSENEIISNLINNQNQIISIINQRINQAQLYLDRLNYSISNQAQSLIYYQKQTISNINIYLDGYILQLISKLNNDQQFIVFETKKIIQDSKNQAQKLWNEIINSVNENLKEQKNQLEIANLTITNLDYRNVLKQGYAIITQNNQLITNKKNFNPEFGIEIEWQDGKIKT